jgi:hypothetical protein
VADDPMTNEPLAVVDQEESWVTVPPCPKRGHRRRIRLGSRCGRGGTRSSKFGRDEIRLLDTKTLEVLDAHRGSGCTRSA